MIGTDGTLPFDPQRIAEDILEEVQNTRVDRHRHPDASKKRRSELKRKTVEEAIEWLNSCSRSYPDKSRITLYLEKRVAHENSTKRKEDSFKEALEMSKRDPKNETATDQRASYDRWVAENHRRLNAAVQATHMDWVTTANKTDVEYHLSLIDVDVNKAIKKVLGSQEAHPLEGRELLA